MFCFYQPLTFIQENLNSHALQMYLMYLHLHHRLPPTSFLCDSKIMSNSRWFLFCFYCFKRLESFVPFWLFWIELLTNSNIFIVTHEPSLLWRDVEAELPCSIPEIRNSYSKLIISKHAALKQSFPSKLSWSSGVTRRLVLFVVSVVSVLLNFSVCVL